MSDDILEDEGFGLFEMDTPEGNAASDRENGALDDVLMGAQSVDAEKQYITFTVDREEYGTPILTVQEIRGWMKTTPLPNMPSYVVGVTNLRGNIVPVFDLRARFSGQLTEVSERHVVIMVQLEARTIGLLVDAISDILTIDAAQIQPPPVGNLVVDIQFLDGLVATDERMVALLNIAKLFDGDLMKNLDASTGGAMAVKEA